MNRLRTLTCALLLLPNAAFAQQTSTGTAPRPATAPTSAPAAGVTNAAPGATPAPTATPAPSPAVECGLVAAPQPARGTPTGSGTSNSAGAGTTNGTAGTSAAGKGTGSRTSSSGGTGQASGTAGSSNAGAAPAGAPTKGPAGGTANGTAGASAPDTTPTTGTAQDRNTAPTSGQNSTAAPRPGLPPNGTQANVDACFARNAKISDLFEIQTSQLALKQSGNAKVKAYAQMMIQEHTASQRKLIAAASKERLGLPSVLPASKQAIYNSLAGQKGAAFDKAYLAAQVSGHKDTADLFAAYAKVSKQADLKAHASATLPVVQKHLGEAQDIEKSLGR